MLAWIMANWGMVASVLLGISEALALIPALNSNSILTAIINALKGIGVKQVDAPK